MSDPKYNIHNSLGLSQGIGTNNSRHIPSWGCRFSSKELRSISIHSNLVTSFNITILSSYLDYT